LLALIEDALQDDRGILAVVYRTASFPAENWLVRELSSASWPAKAERLT
jgi:hypothetical protein